MKKLLDEGKAITLDELLELISILQNGKVDLENDYIILLNGKLMLLEKDK